jgi:hypothetical protein
MIGKYGSMKKVYVKHDLQVFRKLKIKDKEGKIKYQTVRFESKRHRQGYYDIIRTSGGIILSDDIQIDRNIKNVEYKIESKDFDKKENTIIITYSDFLRDTGYVLESIPKEIILESPTGRKVKYLYAHEDDISTRMQYNDSTYIYRSDEREIKTVLKIIRGW